MTGDCGVMMALPDVTQQERGLIPPSHTISGGTMS